MKITVVANLDDAGTMLRKRGLEPGGRVQQLFTSEVAKYAEPYTPMAQGVLQKPIVGKDSLLYNVPYARMMYFGKVMVDPVTKAAGFMTAKGWRSRKGVKKIESDREFKYHGALERGKLWDKRMWADKKRVIVNNVAIAAGGKPE